MVCSLGSTLSQDLDDDGYWTVADLVLIQRMVAGQIPVDLDLADFDNDGNVTIRDVVLMARFVTGSDDYNTTIWPDWGGTIQASDGAMAYFPPDAVESRVKASLKRASDPAPGVVEEKVSVSAEYLLEVETEEIAGHLWAILPLAENLLPGNLDYEEAMDGLSPEVNDPESGRWEPTGSVFFFDPDLEMVFFDVAGVSSGETETADLHQTRQRKLFSKRFRIEARTFSSRYSARRQGSSFKLYYYPLAAAQGTAFSMTRLGTRRRETPVTPTYQITLKIWMSP